MARERYLTKLDAPYLKRITLRPEKVGKGYSFDLHWLQNPNFELQFTRPVTIIVGENGVGKSTFIEALAASSGFGAGGGSRDHAGQPDWMPLSDALRLGWTPKVTYGWFFRAETFFGLASYLDQVGNDSDFLSHSHGEGFMRVFEERMARQGIYFMDEPESALSPKRQLGLLRILNRIQLSAKAQVIMATHSPILMALPGADVWQITKGGIVPVDYRETSHFRLYQEFTVDPEAFIAEAIADETESQF
jgi:predicted ATPase